MATAAGIPVDALDQRNEEIASLRARLAAAIEANGRLAEQLRVAKAHVVAAETLTARRLADLDEAWAELAALQAEMAKGG